MSYFEDCPTKDASTRSGRSFRTSNSNISSPSTGGSTLTNSGISSSGRKDQTLLSPANLAGILQAIPNQPVATTLDSVAVTQIHYEQVGQGLWTNLLADGSKFPDWSQSLNLKVQTLFNEKYYYPADSADLNGDRARITGIIVEYSIDPSLSLFVAAKPGREAYAILRNRFGTVSWTYITSLWSKVLNAPNMTVNPNQAYNDIKTALHSVEQLLGGFTLDSILALTIHLNSQQLFQDIANALDSRIAINKLVKITSKDVLDLVSRHCQSSTDTPSSALLSYSTLRVQSAPSQSDRCGQPYHPSGQLAPNIQLDQTASTFMNRSKEWSPASLNSRNPCTWCFEWGHWALDCPRKKARLPALADPCLSN